MTAIHITPAENLRLFVLRGWLLLVVCAIKAAQDRSWRRGLRRHRV